MASDNTFGIFIFFFWNRFNKTKHKKNKQTNKQTKTTNDVIFVK